MEDIFGIPAPLLFGQLLLGLINGAFYAMMSLGLAVIFGLLNIINFTHGAQFMMGAFAAWMLLEWAGLNYWWALLLVPIIIGFTGVVLERLMISRLYKLDHHPDRADEQRRHDQRDPVVDAEIIQQHPGREGAHHELRAVSEIDDVQQAEDQSQAQAEDGVKGAADQAKQQLSE